MNAITEGGVRIEFPDGVTVRKLDDPAAHGRLDRGMRAVDFVVELPDKILFVEVKEPRDELALKNLDGLVRKFRDSFLYEWAEGRVGERGRPIIYIVLIGLDEVSPGALMQTAADLRWWLPQLGPDDRPWRRPLATDCLVLDLARWNRQLPRFPAVRARPA